MKEPETDNKIWVQEVCHRNTPLGFALYIRVGSHDRRPLGWEEIWSAFSELHPGKWAIQLFPPKEKLVNEGNYYHLFVFDHDVLNLSIYHGD